MGQELKARDKLEGREGSRQIGEERTAMEVREENRDEATRNENVWLGAGLHTWNPSTPGIPAPGKLRRDC